MIKNKECVNVMNFTQGYDTNYTKKYQERDELGQQDC